LYLHSDVQTNLPLQWNAVVTVEEREELSSMSLSADSPISLD
jgi:hypothetical protein